MLLCDGAGKPVCSGRDDAPCHSAKKVYLCVFFRCFIRTRSLLALIELQSRKDTVAAAKLKQTQDGSTQK